MTGWSEPTTLGLTVDHRPRIDLTQPRRRTPDGAGVLFWGPVFGLVLIAVAVLVVRFILRAIA